MCPERIPTIAWAEYRKLIAIVDDGQTVMEYALVVALISVGVLIAATGIGLDVITAAGNKLTALVS